MPRFLISFDDGSMDHIPAQDLPAVGESARGVVRDAKAAGVWIFGGGIHRQRSSIVATDGTVADGPEPDSGRVSQSVSAGETPVVLLDRNNGPRTGETHDARHLRCAKTPGRSSLFARDISRQTRADAHCRPQAASA